MLIMLLLFYALYVCAVSEKYEFAFDALVQHFKVFVFSLSLYSAWANIVEPDQIAPLGSV